MKKICIITLPTKYNYGGLMQSFALQTFLKLQGHQVKTLTLKPIRKKTISNLCVSFLQKCYYACVDQEGYFLHLWKRESYSDIMSKNLSAFIKKYMNVEDFKKPKYGEYDVFIVGSDQVWRPIYVDIKTSFLSFAKKWTSIKRIAYSASFGTDEWEYNEQQTKECKSLLNTFDGISVREKHAVDLCKKYFDKDATWVVDPTMLLSSKDYVDFLDIEHIEKSKGALFYYFLDTNDRKLEIANKISDELKYEKFTVNSKIEQKSAPIIERIQPPVEMWIRAFYDAKFVVTDSFHGCVFSIIFNKPFIAIGNAKRGLSRFLSLLKDTKQEYRLFDEDSTISVDIISILNKKPNSDYSAHVELSKEFLIKNI